MKGKLGALLALSALLAGCSLLRWSGHHKTPEAAPERVDPRLRSGVEPPRPRVRVEPFAAPASTGTARPRPEAPLPELKEPTAATWFYTDLGPGTVDVSEYPAQQKYNYEVYARVCSRCHTLARSINLPVVSRGYWEYYLLTMRGRNWMAGYVPIAKDERKAILDFLEYDSQARKVVKKAEFEALTRELERRFQPVFEERLRRLQQSPRRDEYLP